MNEYQEDEYDYEYYIGDGDAKAADYADDESDKEYDYGEGDEAATGGADGDAGEEPVIVAKSTSVIGNCFSS